VARAPSPANSHHGENAKSDYDRRSESAPSARQQGLSQYDVAYLELVRAGLPLCTLDAELQRAAKATGVELLSV